ncbi:MAG: YoaK family protein [Peptoniphilaceae bacterium]
MKRAKQTSESIILAIFLALSGGFMDAYSYIARGEVFSNAQTGNMLLFGVYASKGNLSRSLDYALPVLSFAFGIALAQIIRFRLRKRKKVHWRQIVVFIEMVLLIFVSGLSANENFLATLLMSFACGMQVQSFRKVHNNTFSTTMCIGNLRSGVHEILEYSDSRKIEHLENGFLYFFVIFCFILGAVIGAHCINFMGLRAIIVSPILLFISIIIMMDDREWNQ